MATPTSTLQPVPHPSILPDFDRDHTASWKDRIVDGVNPGAYARYRAPLSVPEAEATVAAITETIEDIEGSIDRYKSELAQLQGLGVATDQIERSLRRANDARRKYEAARAAYLGWIRLERGEATEPEPAPSSAALTGEPDLRALVARLAAVFLADLQEQMDEETAAEHVKEIIALLGVPATN